MSLPSLGVDHEVDEAARSLAGKVDDGPSLIIEEGELRCLAPEWCILGDTSILFSSGDLPNCTCKVDDFLRFSVGGF